ncbi:MAG: zf-HC2 domain-containing protein [Gemmatimonadaceae bacterium]|jgi:hypothetical protein|nr:zf-HC2 domain-containing protein [Gemmatimonadaceae bacterium]
MMTLAFSCADFEAHLADYLEPGGLDARMRARADAHRAQCAACQSLVMELEAIATSAAALPPLAPSRDLWSGIAERLETQVVALPTASRAIAASAPARGSSRLPRTIRIEWFAAAAVALIAVTATGTWQFARARVDSSASPVASVATTATSTVPAQSATSAVPAAPSASTTSSTAADPSPATPGGTSADAARVASAPDTPTSAAPRARLPRTGTAPLLAVPVSAPSVDVTLSREIDALRTVVDDRFTELDSITVSVIKRNLRIIDAAIAESRKALKQDPRSRFLADQLDRALSRKVELLRQAALLERGA